MITYFLVSFLACQLVFADFRPLPDSSFDTYGNICFEDEKARLDNFAIALQQDPNLIGYIVVYAGDKSCAGEAAFRGNRAKQWVVKRGISAARIIVKDGGFETDVSTRLQPWPRDNAPFEILPGRLSVDEVKIFKRCATKVYHPPKCPK